MTTKEPVSVRLSDITIENLDQLAEYSGKSRSDTLRDLIPDAAMVNAMKEMQQCSNRPARNTAKILKNVFLQTARDRLRREYEGRENPFALQIAVVDRNVGKKPDSMDLFIALCRVERGVRGYEIKKLQVKDSRGDIREEFILTGPGLFDNDESLHRLSWEMEKFLQEYAI